MPARRKPVNRVLLALLSTRPALPLRATAFVLYAVLLFAFVNPLFRAERERRGALSLRLESDAAGLWHPPPVPDATGFLHAEVEVLAVRGLGWTTTTYLPNARFAEPILKGGATAAKPTFGDIYKLWIERVDAGDPAARASLAELTTARQREVLTMLAAREASRSLDPNWQGFEPLTVETGEAAYAAGVAVRYLPAAVLLVAVVLDVLRAAQRREHRARLSEAATGVCPACQYNRYGVAEESPCPECGQTLGALLAESRAALGLPAGRG